MINLIINELKTVVLSGILTFSSLLATLIFTKFLTQSEFGEYGFFITIGQFVMVFSNWGFLNWGVNEITKNFDSAEDIFNDIIKSRIIIGLIATNIVLIYFTLFYSSNYLWILLISYILYSLSFSISPEILYISKNNQNYFIKKSILTRLIFISVTSFLLFSFKINPELLFFIFSLTLFANSLILLLIQNFIKLIPKIKFTFESVKKSSPNFNLIIVSFLFASGPIIFIGTILHPSNFTIVFASVTIVKALQVAYNPSIQKILPNLNNLKKSQITDLRIKINKAILIGLIYSISCIVFVYLFADFIVNVVYSKNYYGIQEGLKIFSLAIIPGIYSTIISSQLSVFFNFINTASRITMISAIFLFITITSFYLIGNLNNKIFLYILVVFEYIQAIFLTLIFLKKIKNY